MYHPLCPCSLARSEALYACMYVCPAAPIGAPLACLVPAFDNVTLKELQSVCRVTKPSRSRKAFTDARVSHSCVRPAPNLLAGICKTDKAGKKMKNWSLKYSDDF